MCSPTCIVAEETTESVHTKCTHPNRVREPPQTDDFDLVSIEDGLGRFDTIPIMGTLDHWEQDRFNAVDVPSGTCNPSDHALAMLLTQSTCYYHEQVLYSSIITSILEVLNLHGPKMLRNKKKIGGSYYYNLCEMLREPDNIAVTATFLMAVSVGKKPELGAMRYPWRNETIKPGQLCLWNMFYDVLALSDEELEETIVSWARTAKEWSLAMIYVTMAYKKLQQESPLYLTGPHIYLYESEEDKDTIHSFVTSCLRAGDDRDSLCNDAMRKMRTEVQRILMQVDPKVQSLEGLKKLTPYDIDIMRFYHVALGQICMSGILVFTLVTWQKDRHNAMRKFRDSAVERMYKDTTMQGLVRDSDANSDRSVSESEPSASSSPTVSLVTVSTVDTSEKVEFDELETISRAQIA
ncbi:hypothetical protein H072_10643 [Dactylellina haptotyla CBS 200.50]|uniref:Uncharacterized protein n=1 Tax=Dactylellina haptotyla (strain CBS 200.50) TaxID=1284197 RepID=S8B9Z7_DACHA|nr:hypothetical protein H072_10643 [Dactylellina haptotyla CBS 200.50]